MTNFAYGLETSGDKKSGRKIIVEFSGTTKALRKFKIVYLLDNSIFGVQGTSPSSSTKMFEGR